MIAVMYLGIRILSGALWSGAITLLIVGSSVHDDSRQLTIFAWCMVVCFAATTCTTYLIVDHLLERNRQAACRDIASAVGVAVGQHLTTRPIGQTPRPTTPLIRT